MPHAAAVTVVDVHATAPCSVNSGATFTDISYGVHGTVAQAEWMDVLVSPNGRKVLILTWSNQGTFTNY